MMSHDLFNVDAEVRESFQRLHEAEVQVMESCLQYGPQNNLSGSVVATDTVCFRVPFGGHLYEPDGG